MNLTEREKELIVDALFYRKVALEESLAYTHCPFCGVKIDGGIDCRKGEKK